MGAESSRENERKMNSRLLHMAQTLSSAAPASSDKAPHTRVTAPTCQSLTPPQSDPPLTLTPPQSDPPLSLTPPQSDPPLTLTPPQSDPASVSLMIMQIMKIRDEDNTVSRLTAWRPAAVCGRKYSFHTLLTETPTISNSKQSPKFSSIVQMDSTSTVSVLCGVWLIT
ncbi:uncharacterized [Tachysurus ichikawai]